MGNSAACVLGLSIFVVPFGPQKMFGRNGFARLVRRDS
jgi:hypothetical protein